MKNKFLLEMQVRGYLNQTTNLNALDEICDKKSISCLDSKTGLKRIVDILSPSEPKFEMNNMAAIKT